MYEPPPNYFSKLDIFNNFECFVIKTVFRKKEKSPVTLISYYLIMTFTMSVLHFFIFDKLKHYQSQENEKM